MLASVVLCAAMPATAWAAPSGRNALVVDVLNDNATNGPYASNVSYDSAGTDVPVAGPSTVVGGVKITRPSAATSGAGLEVLPADGAALTVGHYSDITGQWSSGARPRPVVRLIGSMNGCSSLVVAGAVVPGYLDVLEVSYDGSGVVTSLAADFQIKCSNTGSTATGHVRYQTDRNFASAGSTAAWFGSVAAGSTTPVTATVTNKGSGPLSLGVPTPVASPGAAASLVLAPEGETCSQAPLAPAASCTVHLSYVADGTTYGGIVREVQLAAPGLLRGYVSVLARPQTIVYPPAGPLSVTGDEAYDGVRVRWIRDSSGSAADGFKVRRVDGPSPVLLATLPTWTSNYTDTTLAKGEAGTYQVSTYNVAGETAAPTVVLTRPDLPDPPAAVDRHVLVIEDQSGSKLSTTAGAAPAAHPSYPNLLTVASGSLSLLVGRLPAAPGTYPVGKGAGQIPVGVSSPSYSCVTYGGSTSGTVDIRQAWIGADLTVQSLDADFHLTCAGTLPIEAQVRLGTGTAVSSLTTTGTLTGYSATVGQTPDTKSVQLTNDGDTALVLGAAEITGTDAAAFSVSSPTCPATLAAGDSCALQVAFAPTRSLAHSAKLTFATGTAVGTRAFDLTGTAIGPPPVNDLRAQPVIGRVLVDWFLGYDGGSAITAYHVLRATGDGPFSPVADLGPSSRSYLDTDVIAGGTYRYQLVTDNQYGHVDPPAGAAVTVTVPHEELIAAVDKLDSQPADLAALTAAVESVPVPYGTGQDTDEPALSPDGKWLAYVVDNAAGDTGIWVRPVNVSGAPRKLVDTAAVDEIDPAWSPDGETVAYSRITDTSAALWSVSTAVGASPVALAGGDSATNPSYLPDGTAIVAMDVTTSTLGLVRISPTGVRSKLPGTASGRSPAVSPRGNRIAYVSTDTNGFDRIWLIPVAGGTPTAIGTSVTNYYDRPAWSPDGAAVVTNQYGPYGSADVTLWLDAAGDVPASAQEVHAAGGYDVRGLTWRREDLTAPAVTFPNAPARTGGAARIPVAIVDDTMPVGGLTVTCLVDGKAVARCASGYAGTLVSGTHALQVTAADAYGHSSTSSYAWTVEAAPPTITVGALPAVALTSPITFSYSAKDASGVKSYDVGYRRASAGGAFGAVTAPTGWTATTATSRSLAVVAGYEYCFAVRARDVLDNVSAWSTERCTVAPLDDRALARSGFTQITGTAYYAKTAARATVRGSTLRVGVASARQLYVVATACRGCGTVDVYVGATRIGAVNLASTTTVNRKVFALPSFSVRSGTVVLKVTSSGLPVIVDGLGVRK
ncbi:choice-of-anchor D domain-containing protein [Pengzhenrongella sp.]|uniref:choice-of-anchor D domain-containing protein n=1 Tax=Pengzhenrongella sp. TaxID=2888820 RepID=UPI002F95A8B4